MPVTFSLEMLDAVEFLRQLPAESVDLLITDPAYESLEKHRKRGTTTRLSMSKGSSNAWFDIFPNTRFPEFFEACWRVLKDDTHFYMYCDDETAYIVKPIAEAAGFKYWKRIVWDKMRIGMGYHYRARCEYILFFEKGKRRLNDLGMADVLDLKEDPDGFLLECQRVMNGYPTEKPVWVSEKLIAQSSQPGDLVCDPFMGSGSVGVAALKNSRNFLGGDTSPTSIALASERLNHCVREWQERKQTDLFPPAVG